MRIIHVLSSVMWSGVERYALDICRHYREQGHEVLVVSRDARAVDDVFRHHNIPVTFAPLGGFFSYGAVRAIAAVLSQSDAPTVVHCHDTRDAFSVLISRDLSHAKNVKVVLTRHYVRHAGRSLLHKYVYRNVDHLIFVSQIAKKAFLSGWTLRDVVASDDPRLHVIHNSLNIKLTPMLPEPDKGPVTAIYLGRLSPDKGLEYIIDALARLTDLKLRIRFVGTGHPDYVDSLRRRATTAGVMRMIDWPRHKEEASEFIRASHFGVAPSSAAEAFGLSNIECMAEGRAVIATDNGAQPEYMENGTECILVSPKDPVSIAEAMRRLATSPELRISLGYAARRRFETELSWPHFISKLDAIYNLKTVII